MTKAYRLWTMVLVAAGLLTGAARADAQGASATIRVNLPVTDAVTVLIVSSPDTDVGPAGLNELLAGATVADGPGLEVRSNGPFTVTIAAASPTFGPDAKPSSDVEWATTAGGPFSGLSTAGATILSSGTGGVFSLALIFRMLWALEDDGPGVYELPVQFTVGAP